MTSAAKTLYYKQNPTLEYLAKGNFHKMWEGGFQFYYKRVPGNEVQTNFRRRKGQRKWEKDQGLYTEVKYRSSRY